MSHHPELAVSDVAETLSFAITTYYPLLIGSRYGKVEKRVGRGVNMRENLFIYKDKPRALGS